MFVDDCDLNVKIKALNEIQEMFAIERKNLGEIVALDIERYEPIKDKV